MGLPCPREDNQTAFPRPSHGALKPPVIHGINGVSQKAAGAGHASHYTSLTRRETHGEIVLDGPRILYASTRRQPDRMGLVQQALRKRLARCTCPAVWPRNPLRIGPVAGMQILLLGAYELQRRLHTLAARK
jgi:hypothetical protein